jgi:hypothetical protein
MEFIVISLFIIVIVAWFSIAHSISTEDHKRDVIQKLFDDNIN